ncbi:MAG: hypothetical protein HYR50_01075 [Candidatus Rokubacteria bacterium]|nr:hypothetical protein [Candidatus Rokubacteria bacterium]
MTPRGPARPEPGQTVETRIVYEFHRCGITHVIYCPDSATRALRDVVEAEPGLTLVPVCREGEALGIATGLMLGGKEPVVVHQSTGLFESGDSIRGLALDLGLPVLMLIDYRGWRPTSPATDSAAVFVEPVLRAWGIRYHVLAPGDDPGMISRAFAEARERQAPVAILLAGEDGRS